MQPKHSAEERTIFPSPVQGSAQSGGAGIVGALGASGESRTEHQPGIIDGKCGLLSLPPARSIDKFKDAVIV